jgi:hypothetical protein
MCRSVHYVVLNATDRTLSTKIASKSGYCDKYFLGVSSMCVLCVFLKLIKHITTLYARRNTRNIVLIVIKVLFLVTCDKSVT